MCNTHVYYKIELKLLSPMCIGSGEGINSDTDVVRDSKGRPLIPGTTLAGIYRSLCDDDKLQLMFGASSYYDESTHKTHLNQSPIIVYDGVCSGDGNISVRDSVALDEWKVSKEGAKFDFEVVNTGTIFVTYIELDKNHDKTIETEIKERILPALNNGKLMLGRKTTRGLGRIEIESCLKKTFNFDLAEDKDNWIHFDMFAPWDNATPLEFSKETDELTIKIPLELKGAISIRQYMTGSLGENTPDYVQLTVNGTPVIPGTSWAGAFRRQISEYAGVDEQLIQQLFGYVRGKKSVKSKIKFCETQISGGTQKTITRNSIDRFSAGTKEGALFTEQTYYGGKLELEIRLLKEAEHLKQLVLVAIWDLCNGYIAVGGLTAIGHGLFRLQENEKIKVGNAAYDLNQLENLINSSANDSVGLEEAGNE